MSTITAQEQSQILPAPAAEPFDVVDFDVVPIPMPALAHPAGELVHPWFD